MDCQWMVHTKHDVSWPSFASFDEIIAMYAFCRCLVPIFCHSRPALSEVISMKQTHLVKKLFFFKQLVNGDIPSLAGASVFSQEQVALVFLSLAVLYSLYLKQWMQSSVRVLFFFYFEFHCSSKIKKKWNANSHFDFLSPLSHCGSGRNSSRNVLPELCHIVWHGGRLTWDR